MPRPANAPTPCAECPKIPAWAPEKTAAHAVELSDANRACWEHYQECRAVGCFPDDPLVRRHARLIREVEEGVRGDETRALISLLAANLHHKRP